MKLHRPRLHPGTTAFRLRLLRIRLRIVGREIAKAAGLEAFLARCELILRSLRFLLTTLLLKLVLRVHPPGAQRDMLARIITIWAAEEIQRLLAQRKARLQSRQTRRP